MSVIYLDHAATTPVLPAVMEAMQPYLKEKYANPSGVYQFARNQKDEIKAVRRRIARSLNARENEIYFTSGGTESDNWAIKLAAASDSSDPAHIITTEIEHHAVLNSCKDLERKGTAVTYLPVDEKGCIRLRDLERAVRPETRLISVMYANNEVGAIQPIEQVGAFARKHGIYFHTDAVQAYGHEPVDVNAMHIDMLSASAHKFNGPKGIGFIYMRENVPWTSFLHGGGQERGKRAGTENVPGIIGMGKAVELMERDREEREEHVRQMRDHLTDRLLREIPCIRLNGSRGQRLAGNCNVSIQFIEGESLLILLDEQGICASAGSACSSGSTEASHVLKAMGLPDRIAHGTVRFTIGVENTMQEMDTTVECVKKVVERLRETSGEYEDYKNNRW